MTKGVGRHGERLSSFELALRDAGIAEYNLVTVSSIFPPKCKIVTKEQGRKSLSPGQIVHIVMSRQETNEPHRLVASSVGVAIPTDRGLHGYLSEHHSYGETEKLAGDYAEDLAAEMLATVLGVEINPEESWDKKREQWRISGKVVKTINICQSAVGDKNGLWTTVVAGCVLIP